MHEWVTPHGACLRGSETEIIDASLGFAVTVLQHPSSGADLQAGVSTSAPAPKESFILVFY